MHLINIHYNMIIIDCTRRWEIVSPRIVNLGFISNVALSCTQYLYKSW